MKMLIQSLLFIVVVGLFAVTSDRLAKIEQKEDMGKSSTTESSLTDQAFLSQMIEHHDGAIFMAKEAQEKSNRPEIKDFTGQIISAQTSEIERMYTWRNNWFGQSDHIGMRMGVDMPSMAVDLGTHDPEFDLRFLDAMIAHHEGAIEMSTQVIVPTDRPEIHDLATSIISSQSQEIALMKAWRSAWYGK